MKPALIFDLDGTLWDASVPVSEAWTIVGRRFFSPSYLVTPEMTKAQMGKTMTEIGKSLAVMELDPDTLKRFMDECFSYEVEYMTAHPGTLFPGTIEALSLLISEGYDLYIVSNCQSGYIENFIPLVPGLFRDHMCWSDTRQEKAVTIRALMERHGIEDAIYIGDTGGDEQAARKAGIHFIHAAYGFGTVESPDAVATSIAELPATINDFCGKKGLNHADLASSGYLSSDQIRVLKERLAIDEKMDAAEQFSFLTMADSFVRGNGRADAEYEAIYAVTQKIISLQTEHLHFPNDIAVTFPLLFLFCFYDYIYLIGVFSEDEIKAMRQNAFNFASGGGNVPTA